MGKMEKEMVGETGAQTGHKSRPHRHALQLKSVLAIPALDRQVKARIRNISAGGLMAETPLPIGRGERVEIDLPNIGYIGGKVIWAAEGKLGIAFDHPINPADIF